jgi:hypothetical protein
LYGLRCDDDLDGNFDDHALLGGDLDPFTETIKRSKQQKKHDNEVF